MDQFEAGVGRGLDDMVYTLEPDVFICHFGYAAVWAAKSQDDVASLAARYMASVEQADLQRANLTTLLVGLPVLPSTLANRYPETNPKIEIFNALLRGRAPLFIEPSAKLRSDNQHFSNAGHGEVARRILTTLENHGVTVKFKSKNCEDNQFFLSVMRRLVN